MMGDKQDDQGISKGKRDNSHDKCAQVALAESEERLRNSQLRLELIQKAAKVASWDWNLRTGEIKWYGNAENVYGVPPPNNYDSFLQLVWQEDVGRVEAAVEQAIAEQGDYEVEFRVTWPDGSVHWVSGRGKVFCNEGHEPGYFLGVNMEISSRKRAETERDRFFELSADPSCIAGFDGYFKRVNPAWQPIFGYTPEELTNRPWIEFVHPDDRAATIAEGEKLFSGIHTTAFENRYRSKDGSYRWLLWSVRTDPTEKQLICIARDITDRKQTESLFQSLANSIPQLAWMADSKGWIFWYNQRWYDYTGTTLEEVEGWGWKKVHHPAHVDRVIARIQHSWDTGEPWEDSFPLRGKNGQWRWFLSRALPIRDALGNVTRWFGTNTDITEAREAAEALSRAKAAAEEANRAKSDFLANMSHEIRTPLGAIVGFSELLKVESVPSESRNEFIDAITRNCRELTRLIDDILDLSKVEAGRMEIEHLAVSLPSLMDDVVTSLKPKVREKGIELIVNFDKNVPEVITSDATRLRQILLNIIGNAVKFTDKGGVSIAIKLLHTRDDTTQLAFIVKDTGAGLAPETQSRIFQPFMQADSSTTRKYGGTGLGLALARNLARALGGDVILSDSELKKGSTFVVTIDPRPIQEIGESKSIEESRHRAKSHSAQELSGIKVLVAEDSFDNQLLTRLILQRAGASVEVVDNGSEAVNMALADGYDLILMDVAMPVLDGYAATKELRRRGFTKPIIAITAHAMRGEKEKSLKAGCNDHLTKPLDQKELIAIVARYAR